MVKNALNPGQMKMVAHGEIIIRNSPPSRRKPRTEAKSKDIKAPSGPDDELGWGKTKRQRVLINDSEFSSPG